MLGQLRAVMPTVSALMVLIGAKPALAHGVEAEFRVLANRQIRIEAWYDVTADPTKNAKVSVFDGGTKITEGHMDDKGVFKFSIKQATDLRVVVDAGGGHRANLRIPAAALATLDNMSDSTDRDSPAGSPQADRISRVSFKDTVLGVAFVLAAAAFWLSWRNARRISEMRNRSS